MSLFTKPQRLNQISVRGNGNILIQLAAGESQRFNINNPKDLETFFGEFKGILAEIGLRLNEQQLTGDEEADRLALLNLLTARLTFDKYFFYKKEVSEITPKDILDFRASSFRESYHERSSDIEFRRQAGRGENVLLIGNSLSGKTRAVYEWFAYLTKCRIDAEVYFPRPVTSAISSFELLHSPKHRIVFFDDVDLLYDSSEGDEAKADWFLGELIRSGFQIIATSRTGPEYDKFLSRSSWRIRELFGPVVRIGKISEAEAVEFAKREDISIEETEFDGNIGSLILPILKMRDRYAQLTRHSHESHRLAVNLLKSCKALYFSSNIYSKSKYDFGKVEDYWARLTVGRHASLNQQDSSEFQQDLLRIKRRIDSERIENFLRYKEAALDILQSDDVNLNFIALESDGKFLRVEEAYLDTIVDYPKTLILRDIDTLYESTSRQLFGFFVKTGKFNRLIKRAASYAIACEFFDRMTTECVVPDSETYASMIEKSEDEKEAKTWYDQAREAEALSFNTCRAILGKGVGDSASRLKYLEELLMLAGNELTESPEKIGGILHCYSAKQTGYTDPHSLISLFEKYSVPIPEASVNILLNYAKSVEMVRSLIHRTGVPMNTFAYESLVRYALSFEEATEFAREATVANIPRLSVIYARLIQVAPSLATAKDAFQMACFNNIQLDEKVCSALIEKAPSLEAALELMPEVIELQPEAVGVRFMNALVTKAPTSSAGLEIISVAAEAGMAIDETSFRILLNKTSVPEEINCVIDAAFQYGLIVDHERPIREEISQIREASTVDEAWEYVRTREMEGHQLDNAQVGALMGKGATPDERLKILTYAVREKKLVFKAKAYHRVVDAVSSVEEAANVVDELQKLGFAPDSRMFEILVQRGLSLKDVIRVFERAGASVLINEGVFERLAEKSTSVEEGYSIFLEGMRRGLSFRPAQYGMLCSKAKSASEAMWLVDKALANSVRLDTTFYTRVVEKASSVAEVFQVVDLLSEQNILVPDSIAITAVGKATSFREAVETIEFCQARGFAPPLRCYVSCYQWAISEIDRATAIALTQSAGFDPGSLSQTKPK